MAILSRFAIRVCCLLLMGGSLAATIQTETRSKSIGFVLYATATAAAINLAVVLVEYFLMYFWGSEEDIVLSFWLSITDFILGLITTATASTTAALMMSVTGTWFCVSDRCDFLSAGAAAGSLTGVGFQAISVMSYWVVLKLTRGQGDLQTAATNRGRLSLGLRAACVLPSLVGIRLTLRMKDAVFIYRYFLGAMVTTALCSIALGGAEVYLMIFPHFQLHQYLKPLRCVVYVIDYALAYLVMSAGATIANVIHLLMDTNKGQKFCKIAPCNQFYSASGSAMVIHFLLQTLGVVNVYFIIKLFQNRN